MKTNLVSAKAQEVKDSVQGKYAKAENTKAYASDCNVYCLVTDNEKVQRLLSDRADKPSMIDKPKEWFKRFDNVDVRKVTLGVGILKEIMEVIGRLDEADRIDLYVKNSDFPVLIDARDKGFEFIVAPVVEY